MRRRLTWVKFAAVSLALAASMHAHSADDETCLRCHSESSTSPVFAIAKSPHGRTGADAPSCASCHGASERHAGNIRQAGETRRPKTDRIFETWQSGRADRRSPTAAVERNAACVGCHSGDSQIHWQGSAHEARDVTCTSCHQVHARRDAMFDKAAQADVCLTCHREQRTQMRRRSRHPIEEGKMGCSDCHNAHGAAGPSLLTRDNTVDTCSTCHMEKRGPFVFNHQPVTEDCAICHNPHGSNIEGMLKSRPSFLCQQCHEPTLHVGDIPGFLPSLGTTAGGRGLTQGRACVSCHTNIHGSNNPLDGAPSRSLRR